MGREEITGQNLSQVRQRGDTVVIQIMGGLRHKIEILGSRVQGLGINAEPFNYAIDQPIMQMVEEVYQAIVENCWQFGQQIAGNCWHKSTIVVQCQRFIGRLLTFVENCEQLLVIKKLYCQHLSVFELNLFGDSVNAIESLWTILSNSKQCKKSSIWITMQ